MKQKFYFTLFTLALACFAAAQSQIATSYCFSQAEEAYVPQSEGIVLISGNFDDQVVEITSLPAFTFNNLTYTSMWVSTNGYLTLGAAPNMANLSPISNNGSYDACIAPFGHDLEDSPSGNPQVSYEILAGGNGPEIWIEWRDVRRFGSSDEQFSFQLFYNVNSGWVQFVYNASMPGATASGAQVGLRGATNSDFLNRAVTTANNWDSSVAGSVNNSTCRFSSTNPSTFPSVGMAYTFSYCEVTFGCMDPVACNYDAEATNSGTCEYCTCEAINCGCTDAEACNYDAQAAIDNGSCDYSCQGCTDPLACNYNAAATVDDGSCHFQSLQANAGPDQYISQTGVYSVPLAASTYIAPASGTWSTSSPFVSVSNLNNPSANVNFSNAAYPIADLVWTVVDPLCGTTTSDNVQISLTGCNFNQSASAGSNSNNVCLGDTVPIVGSISNFPVISSWSLVSGSGTILNPYDQVAYVINLGLGENVFQYTLNYSACGGGTSSDTNSITTIECIEGCTDSGACNYNVEADTDDGSCDYSCQGCTDPEAYNYDAEATVDNGTCVLAGSGVACSVPIPLDCSVGYYSEMTVGVSNDNLTSDATACGGPSNAGQRWYVYDASFSSEVTVSTIGALTNFDTYLKVYTGTCGDLTCVTQNDDVPGTSFQSQCVFDAVAGTTYLIRVGGFASSEGTFSLTINCGGGCLDDAACNYDMDAPFDDGSCTYGEDCFGCIDDAASNYDPIAVYDNGSCLYNSSIVVYHDLNGDGTQQFNEPGLSNWAVYISGLQATIYTNAEGIIDFALPSASFVLDLVNDTENWISTSPSSVTIDVPNDMIAGFGLIPSTGETFFIAGPYDGFWDIVHCTDGYEAGVFISNTGSVNLNGTITMICDALFTPEGDAYGTIAPDLVGPGFAQWNINGYLPGEAELFSFHVDGPGVEYIGDTFEFTFQLVLNDAENNEIYNVTYETSPFVACSYDPNDITATPEGYAEPHYILPGERIEYRIRFQNTGNLPAEDILIVDMLNTEVFDITTFEPMYASATVTACLHDDGMLDFMFNDIYLPDSTNNEEESHGFVVYSVELLDNLAPGTVIENYADIYFEQNPAITTNTAFHTIFDCQSFVVASGDDDLCAGEVTTLTGEQPYVEAYNWTVDGESVGMTAELTLTSLSVGTHIAALEVTNPLCSAVSEIEIIVHPTPAINAGSDVAVCAGEEVTLNATSNAVITWSNGVIDGESYIPAETQTVTATATTNFDCTADDVVNITVNELPGVEIVENGATLTAPDGAAWQWYLNGQLLEDETAQTIEATQGGVYYVVTTNENNCSEQSESISIIGVEDLNTMTVAIYPNPMNEAATVLLPAGLFHIALYDVNGKQLEAFDNCQNQFILSRKALSAGSYQLVISNQQQTCTVKVVLN